MALRSLIETVACQRLIIRRNYMNDNDFMGKLDLQAQELAKRLHAFRRSLANSKESIGEEQARYETDEL